MKNEIVVYVQLGLQNDEKEISRALKLYHERKLKNAELENGRVKLTFSKPCSNDPGKRVLQVSKRKYSDLYSRIIHVLKNEEQPKKFLRRHKEWQVLSIIELTDKWLVFLV